MPVPSRMLAMGNPPGSVTAIAGYGATGLVAVGTTATDALQLTADFNAITTSSASTGVKLPPTESGAQIVIRNDSGQTITVYPPTGSTVNAAASSVTLATAKTMVCYGVTATTWATITTA